MSYFTNFPTMVYDLSLSNEPANTVTVRDITKNVRFRKDILDNVLAYQLYEVQDGDTPEKISELVYGTPYYHWIIMLVNERFDYLNDFPMAQREIEALIDKKYGDQKFATRHYETVEIKNSKGTVLLKSGLIVSSTYTFTYVDGAAEITVPNNECAVPVTNYDYEYRKNEEKRQLKILAPETLDEIIYKFRDALGLQ